MNHNQQIVPRYKNKGNYNGNGNNLLDINSLLQLAALANNNNNNTQITKKKYNKSKPKIEEYDSDNGVNGDNITRYPTPKKAIIKKTNKQNVNKTDKTICTSSCFDKIWTTVTDPIIARYKKSLKQDIKISPKENKEYSQLFSFIILYSSNLYTIVNDKTNVIISSAVYVDKKILSNQKTLIVLINTSQDKKKSLKLYVVKSEDKHKEYILNEPVTLDIDTIENDNIVYKLKIMNSKKTIDTFIFTNKNERNNWKKKLGT